MKKYPEHLLKLIGPQKKFSGHVRKHPSNGYLYIVINDYKRDIEGRFLLDINRKKIRDPQWIPTGLKIRGNITKAESMIPEAVANYTQYFINKYSDIAGITEISGDMPFVEYLYYWLGIKKLNIRKTTYSSYKGGMDYQIAPYFRALGLSLNEVKEDHIQAFYSEQADRGITNNSIIKYHVNLYSAFRHAVKSKKIATNPMELVIRPKPETFIGSYYSKEEVKEILECSKNSKLELPILFASFYGLRRSEIVGLRWDCVNFDDDTFMIRHTVTQTYVDGHTILVEEDRAKSSSSIRSLPLVAPVKEKLLSQRKQQAEYMRICGNSYNNDYLDYICVNQIGDRIKPNYITDSFTKLLERNGLRKIRFHDLRHTCASLLVANGVSMKDIQEWLGHSDIQTTSRYAHIDMNNKKASANIMLDVANL